MATTAYYTNQYISTTLAAVGGITDSATTGIILASTTNITLDKPGIACLSYTDPIDTSIAEWITYTSIDAGTKELQGVTRGQEGYSAKAHSNGVTVAFPLSKSHINNLNTALSIGGVATNIAEGVLDEDDMASDSATKIPTQQSVKAYVDSGTVTMTNKTIDGDDNTIQDIASESLKSTIAFSAYRGTTDQTIGDTTFTKIECNIEEFDEGGDYDNATNYRFVAPVAGIYQFNGAVHLEALADGNRILATLYKQGSEFKRGSDTRVGGNNDGGSTVSALIKLAANEYVELYVFYDGTGTKVTVGPAVQYSHFSGFLVGRTA